MLRDSRRNYPRLHSEVMAPSRPTNSPHPQQGLWLESSRSADTPAVTVIVIAYNADRFLREAIESVLGQTFDDWEILIVDDGSADATRDVANDLAQQRPSRIHVLQH